MMIFTFAGSSHSKYTTYLLEMYCSLELEMSPELRTMFLDNWLVVPSGLPGHYLAGDKLQEQLQDRLYEHISPDQDFDAGYVRDVIAPNVYRFERMKKDLTAGLGLAKRSSKHVEPHHNAETRKLLSTYQAEELHLFRAGQTYGGDAEKVDNLGRGQIALWEKKLASWIEDTLRPRGITQAPTSSSNSDSEDEEDTSENSTNETIQTRGSVEIDESGRLIIDMEANVASDNEGIDAVDSDEDSEEEDSGL